MIQLSLSVTELESFVCGFVKEIPVVGDYNNCLFVLGNKILKPEKRVHVKVVCRLVKYEQIGLSCQQTGKRKSRVLTSAERGNGQRKMLVGKAHIKEPCTAA